ncbi:hypothetical protein D3C80_2079820 [compost metagenome]
MQRHLGQMLIQLLKLLNKHRNQVDGDHGKRGQEYRIDQQHSHTARHLPAGQHADHRVQNVRYNHGSQKWRQNGF